MAEEKWLLDREEMVGINKPKNPDTINMNQLILELPCLKENKYIFFCPCYVRIWINNFS